MAAYYEQQPHIPGSSSPRKGIIRLVQHERSPILSNDHGSLPAKPEGRNDSAKPSMHGASLASDPVRQHSYDERKAYNRQRRKENDNSRSRNMDRANVMRRENSAASHNVREGMESGPPISLLTRSSPLDDGSKGSGRFARVNMNDGENSEASDIRSAGRRNTADHSTSHRSGEDSSKRYHHNHRSGGNHGPAREVHSRHGGRLNDSDIASISHGGGGGGRSAGGSTSGAKLFDPRKDDPVRFAANRKGLGITSTDANSVAGMSDARSFASSATPSMVTMSTASSEGKERRRRRGPGSRATTDSGEGSSSKRKGHGAAEGAISDNNSYVIELKRRYRDVVVLERKLQDEHKLASEQERKYQAEQSSNAQMTNSSTMSRTRTNTDRHGFNPDGSLHHTYWLDLIAKHRTLAELHVAFMEAALRPGLPASLHSLPQSYKIPTRLWHTAFHSLLERFRQSLPDWQTCIAMRDSGVPPSDREKINEMLDLFTEYIYYAYSYYTNILESELFKVFRSSWIENLGDLARYRMAVAKIMSFLGVRDGVRHGAERRDSGSQSRTRADRKTSIESQLPTASQEQGDGADEEALEVASAEMGKDQASIGAAAAQDWDLEEKEIWRSTARGWYAKGLADVPGTGRLHHHLGVLSRDDELRSLYHFCKSLTTSHPYPSARESILPLFERSAQARRISEEASIVDLFVHMHGILFTRIQVDDFDGVYVRFKKLLTLRLRENDFRNGSDTVLLSPSSWMMMATINIAAILQYGAGQESGDETKAQQGKKADKHGEEDEGEEDEDDDEQAEGDDNAGEEEEADESNFAEGSSDLPCATQKACRLAFDMLEAVVDAFAEENKAAANPYITLMLTFLSQECKSEGYLRKLEKFVPWESLVKLGNSIPASVESIDPRNDATLKIRSDAIPLPEDWCLRGMAWVGRRVYERGFWKPHKVERLGLRSSLALFENELEMIDRCTRCTNGGDISDRESQSGTSHPEDHHNEEDDDDDDDDEDSEVHGAHGGDQSSRPRLTLTLLRWKRITHALTILIKTVPGMDFDIDSGYVHARHGRMVLAPPLSRKVVQWRADEAREEVEGAIGHLKLAALEGRTASPDQIDVAHSSTQIALTVEEEDDLDEDEVEVPSTETGDISAEIMELTKKRNELRKQLRIGKAANHYRSTDSKSAKQTPLQENTSRHQSSAKPKESTKTSIRIVPGYTTLLLDTNVMLTPTDILSQLIKSKRWMVIIPLSVITELDGLKRREGDVGKRAQDAIKFLEEKVKTHSTNFKVQTSRGNYLTDLRFRTEDIDFGANNKQTDGDHDELHDPQTHPDASEGNEDGKCAMARSVDDVILRCLSWQAGAHFRNRLLLLCSDDEERAKREAEIAKKNVPSVAKAVLVTLDRNLRIKARFRSLSAIGPSELIDLLLEESST
ncbi:uncharacterized protein FA14DRAFT_159387 [Meira miltonrushii]|uniref:PIN domain-containing protein n=1 Tax=Meira miltonrushii TaxID=1280837 RepID=A0A316VIC2_9BASI|nr:uncharacterized protein FA14DRAFT_159387 [Meira miltonrushii]PWN37250.1 hypothetical protein FA14DRAFT_159387 [Meira miltonrushii]